MSNAVHFFAGNLILIVTVSCISGAVNHDCSRHCTASDTSGKLCSYEFFVTETASRCRCRNETTEDHGESCEQRLLRGGSLVINGVSPGPPIEVCVGDTIEVLVHNKLGSEELSVHWHGIRQEGSLHMDGVTMVTQCSILPYGAFRYKFKAQAPGTYFYRAHSVSQQADGVYGSLAVRGPQDDPTLERILLLSSRPPTPLRRYSHLYPPAPSELLLNGQSDGAIVRVNDGSQYLLRLVNAAAFNCPILLSATGHTFRVVAADGNLVQSMTSSRAIIFPGERVDLSLEANASPATYSLRLTGLQDCRHLKHEAYIVYDGTNFNPESNVHPESINDDDSSILERGFNCQKKNVICTLDLRSQEARDPVDSPDETLYIPFDVNTFSSYTDSMTDEKYNFYSSVFYPAYLSIQEKSRVAQVNGMSFKYPTSPLSTQPDDTPEELICSLEEAARKCDETPFFCECIQIIQVPPQKTIEVILIDEGFGGNVSQTFHVHGYSVKVLGRNSFGRQIRRSEVVAVDSVTPLARNFVDPPRKDTFVVPNKGYVILRFQTDNLGYWLWEARSTGISPNLLGPGMQFLMKVGSSGTMPSAPPNFPTCSNNKGMDLLFEGD